VTVAAPNTSASGCPPGVAPQGCDIPLTNQATVNPHNTIPEGNLLNNSAVSTNTVHSFVDLKISKTGPSTASQSDTTDYNITVMNVADPTSGSGMNALNVQVHDPLPVGMIVLNATLTPSNMAACQVQQNPVNVVDCTIPVLQSGASNNVTIDVQVFITAQSGTLSNEACVDPNNTVAEYDESNNCSTIPTTVVPPAPKLSINKVQSASTLNPGDPETCTLTVTNVGTQDTSGTVTVTDVLDSRLANVSATGDTGFTCTLAPSTETCTTSTVISQGQAATITITANLVSPVPTTSAINNMASVTGGGAASANSQTVIASVGAGTADFTITGGTVTSTPAIVAPDGVVTYQFTASNIGTADATGVTVTDTLSPPSDVMTVIAGGTNGFSTLPRRSHPVTDDVAGCLTDHRISYGDAVPRCSISAAKPTRTNRPMTTAKMRRVVDHGGKSPGGAGGGSSGSYLSGSLTSSSCARSACIAAIDW
jgi:uncharacterized repeat protein (TIGR01451 family)